MDQTIINLIIAATGGLFGFIMKSLYEAIKELQKADRDLADKVSSIEVLVAGKYVTRDELATAINRIVSQLDRIEEKLQGKADK